MRRSDREITDRSDIDAIIRGAQVCRLAFARGDEPYIVPLSYGYDGAAFYFHTARRGRKIEFIAANPRVCFEVEGEVMATPDSEDACEWGFSYESVVGYGTISELTSPDGKAYGLDRVMLQYSGREWGFASSNLDSVRVWRLEVESVTGKRCPLDAG
ncbi:MAG: pyridoxamine 5'-phosphate oxidase family protein [Anaerolineae bacterium]